MIVRKYKRDELAMMKVCPVGKVHDEYPHLKETFPDETELKYLAWMYDPYSPVVRAIDDIEERDEAARALSGMAEGIEPRHEQITAYCARVAKPGIYAALVTTEKTIAEFNDLARRTINVSEVDDEKILKAAALKLKLIEGITTLEEKKQALVAQLYSNDIARMEAAQSAQRTTPESMAAPMIPRG